MRTRVVDERSTPPLRRVIGRLLTDAELVDLALTRIRLAALDLTASEIDGPSQCRVLLGRLDAGTLFDAAAPPPARLAERLAALRRLQDWLDGERLEVRSAGIRAWTPDFSIFVPGSGRATCLLGAHYFGEPHLTVGPSVTVVLRTLEARSVLESRFEELWKDAHDVAPAIREVLGRAVAMPGRGGGA